MSAAHPAGPRRSGRQQLAFPKQLTYPQKHSAVDRLPGQVAMMAFLFIFNKFCIFMMEMRGKERHGSLSSAAALLAIVRPAPPHIALYPDLRSAPRSSRRSYNYSYPRVSSR